MHCMVVVGVLGYGVDASANQAARLKCHVRHRSRDLVVDNEQATCFFPAASENPAPPQHAGEMGFWSQQNRSTSALSPTDVKARGRAIPATRQPVVRSAGTSCE